jgi:hypothetical protein
MSRKVLGHEGKKVSGGTKWLARLGSSSLSPGRIKNSKFMGVFHRRILCLQLFRSHVTTRELRSQSRRLS